MSAFSNTPLLFLCQAGWDVRTKLFDCSTVFTYSVLGHMNTVVAGYY